MNEALSMPTERLFDDAIEDRIAVRLSKFSTITEIGWGGSTGRGGAKREPTLSPRPSTLPAAGALPVPVEGPEMMVGGSGDSSGAWSAIQLTGGVGS